MILPLTAPDAPPLVLASGSSTRASMLTAAGLIFDVVRPSVDEEALRESLAASGVDGENAATALAELKAQRVAAAFTTDVIVLGADQLLELDGAWLAKAPDLAAARSQLRTLAGRRHRLISAVVAFRNGARVWHHVDAATLWMRALSDDFLDAYLHACGDAAVESVGAYRLEAHGAQLFHRVQGDWFTILGMPLLPLLQFLRDQGVLRS